ncbi:hypothetical protein BU14_3126s0001, partial [Porphyra umbilicalis]
ADGAPPAATVHLIVDRREARGSGAVRAAFLDRLGREAGLGGRVVERTLAVGDAVLVARITPAGAAAFAGAPPAGTEVVLDELIERKTVDDLASSFRDARYEEQAYYMAAAGLPSLVYVVEGDPDPPGEGAGGISPRGKAHLASLAVTAGFVVKHTRNLDETAAYYASLVRHRERRLATAGGLEGYLTAKRAAATAASAGAAAAAAAGGGGGGGGGSGGSGSGHKAPARTLQQLWALQLHVLPGVAAGRVADVMAAGYTTPAALAAAYGGVTDGAAGAALLAGIEPAPGHRRVTAAVSSYLYNLFCAKSYGNVLL